MSTPPAKRIKKTDGRTSLVWSFFVRPKDSSAPSVACPKCKVSIAFKGSTTSLNYHLEHKHPVDYEQLKNEEASGSRFQTRVTTEIADKYLAKSLAVGLVPFRFVENEDFRIYSECLQEMAEPYKVPSASKIRRIIEELHIDHQTNLKGQLQKVNKYSLITDGFSDLKRSFQFYSLHVSFVDENFQRKILFCGIKGTNGGDSVSIGETLCDMLQKCNLRFTDCSALASDGASPLVLLADIHDLNRIHCGCHTLNLIIRDFAKVREIQNVEMRVGNFASHLARTKADKANLKAMSASIGIKSQLPLPLPATRWAGLPILLDQYLAHYKSASNLTQLQRFLVKSEMIEKIEEIRDLLKPFLSAIRRLEKDASHASEIIPTLRFLLNTVERSQSRFSNKLKELVHKRLAEALKNKRLLCSMALDHRYAYIDSWIEPVSWNRVELDLQDYISEEPLDTSATQNTLNQNFDSIDDFLQSSVVNFEASSDKIESELLRYKALLDTNRPNFSDPLEFWRGNKINFPKLASVASELFSTPASSSISERLFSRCTNVLRQTRRSRLKLETLNSLLTVNELSQSERKEQNLRHPDVQFDDEDEDSSEDEGDESEVDDEEMDAQFPYEKE